MAIADSNGPAPRLPAAVIEADFGSILDSAHEAFVSVDAAGTVVAWNRAAEQTFGWTREEALGRPLVELVIPEGLRAAYERGLRRSVVLQEAEALGERLELVALHRDGRELEIEVAISAAGTGGERRLNAFIHDVSDRKRAERELHEARERFEKAFEAAPIAMGIHAVGGCFIDANAALCELLGRTREELTQLSFEEITAPADLEESLAACARLLDGEASRCELEQRCLRRDGSLLWGLISISLVRDSEGEPVHFVVQIQDITARREAEAELRSYSERLSRQALKDPLTGLRNLRDFHDTLEHELERARRHGGEFSLVLLDIEGFAALNAERGHAEGDRALKVVAEAVTGATRLSDLTARIGGDEFALVLPETDEEGAEATVERIKAAITDRGEPELELSHGIVCCPAAGDSKELLLLRADMELYRARTRTPAPASNGRPISSLARGRIERILALAREQLDLDVSFLGELTPEGEVFHVVEGDGASFGLEPGTEVPLSETYCHRMVEGRIPSIVADSAHEPELAGLACTRERTIGSYIGVPLRFSDGRLYGALCGLNQDARQDLSERDVELLRFLGGLVAELLENAHTDEDERRQQLELSGIHALIAALEARDAYTGEHSKFVVGLAGGVARRLGMSPAEVQEVEQVAMLHDVGKVGIPDSILQKRGPLSEEEWELMRQHPAVGERIIANTDSLSRLAPAIRAEHERFDGAGYPDGLRADEIPIASRITLACDAYHAMTSDRPYRRALSAEAARGELEANAGTQFDPAIVAALIAELHGAGSATPRARRGRRERHLPGAPAWDARPVAGGDYVLAEVRAACRRCGAHVTATVLKRSIAGSCGNCGSSDLDLVAG